MKELYGHNGEFMSYTVWITCSIGILINLLIVREELINRRNDRLKYKEPIFLNVVAIVILIAILLGDGRIYS